MPDLIETSAEEVQTWIDEGTAMIVDVREDNEVVQHRIAGETVHLPLSRFNPDAVPTDSGKRVIFVCAQGVRSFQAGQYILDQEILSEAYNLSDGIAGWAQAGLPLESG